MSTMEIVTPGAYGLEGWPEEFTQFEAELALYAQDDLRNSSTQTLKKHEHLKNAIQLVFDESVLVWHDWLEQATEAWCYEPIATEWGCSGVGKSSDYGLLALMDCLAEPENTKTVIITNPMEMHWSRCFKYVNYYYSLLPKQFQFLSLKKSLPMCLYFDHERIAKETKQDIASKQTGIFCYANRVGDDIEDLKKRIGSHEKRMRLIVDEPQGCSPSVLKLIINMTAGCHDFIERFIGNPTGRTDSLGMHSEPEDGDWKKTEHLNNWRTKRVYKGNNGICFVRDARESPAFTDPEKFYFMFNEQNQSDAKANYGDNTQEYFTYAVGRLMGEGGSNVIITEEDLDDLKAYREVIWDDNHQVDYAGLDAASEGGDGTELYRVRVGRELNGQTVAVLVESATIYVNVKKADKSGQIAKQVIDKLDSWGIPLERLAGDKTGNQGPIFDRIEVEWEKKHNAEPQRVYRVDASGFVSSERPIFAGSNVKRCDRYYNRSTELFFNVIVALQKKQLVLRHIKSKEIDSHVVHQITTRLKEDQQPQHKNKIKIEKKLIWRQRNSGKSPDNLDAIQQFMAMLVEKGLLVLNEEGQDKTRQRKRNSPRNQGRETRSQRLNRRQRVYSRL